MIPEERRAQYLDQALRMAADVGTDGQLFAAIIEVESGWNPWAVRFEPILNISRYDAKHFALLTKVTEETERTLVKCSWGLGQILGTTARSLGFVGPLPQLCDAQCGLMWAAAYLKKCIKRFETTEEAISAYNAGTPKYDDFHHFLNQAYVDRVLLTMHKKG